MKVKFVPVEKELEIKPGQSVLELAHENGIPIRSTCNGLPSCAECRVRVTEGEYNLMPPSKKETNLIGTGYYIDQRRLSCQMQCFGDITVDVTEHMGRENEGPITKKFLSRVQKSSAQESHSVGGVLIEQEVSELKELSSSVGDSGGGEAPTSDFYRERGQGRGQPQGGRGQQQGRQQGQGGGGNRGGQQRRGQNRGGGRPQQQGGRPQQQGQQQTFHRRPLNPNSSGNQDGAIENTDGSSTGGERQGGGRRRRRRGRR